MKKYDNFTSGLQAVLLQYTRGYTRWVTFEIDIDKLGSLTDKFIEQFGTNLPAYKKQDRKEKGLANAWACSVPVLGKAKKVQIILLATEHADTMKLGPFSREKWRKTPPEIARFVMVQEPRPRGDYAWTWRIQNAEYGQLTKHLTAEIKTSPRNVKLLTEQFVRIYPMFGGVRRQMCRLLNAGAKLWKGVHKDAPWPGVLPEALPVMIGFRVGK
jgi:hypothetical protein